MRFGLFGSAQARRPSPGAEMTDSSQGFREWIENNVEAEALGFHSTFVVEHHFTGFGQVSASLNLLTWLGARPITCRSHAAILASPNGFRPTSVPAGSGLIVRHRHYACFARCLRAWFGKPSHTAVPAEAGTHFSTSRVAGRWTPAFAGDAVSGMR